MVNIRKLKQIVVF